MLNGTLNICVWFANEWASATPTDKASFILAIVALLCAILNVASRFRR